MSSTDEQCLKSKIEAAIGLWRGELLQDLALSGAAGFEEWLTPVREHTRQQLLSLISRLSEAYLALGQPERAIPVLRRWLWVEPWAEPAHRALMLALARLGQYTEALAQYEVCSTTLRRELDLAPMPETQALAERIQFARGLVRRDNVPPSLTPLLGREADLAQLQRQLLDPDCRLLSLCGLGGMGKTRLALQAAATLRHAFLHGVWYVPLEACNEPLGLPAAVAAALDLPLTGGIPPEQAVREALRERELLIVLDGFEALLEAALLYARRSS
ncbi:MAG: BTAD domain-containing putative transcriptional regulator [Oscillochloridaceae bacterium umkhey_bin13]